MAEISVADNQLFEGARGILDEAGLPEVEIEMLLETNKLLMRSYPTTANGVERRMEQLSHYRVRLTNILLRVKRDLIKLNKERDMEYNKKFSNFATATNATNKAIESRVMSKMEYQNINERCEVLNNVYKYLFSLIKDVDEVKSDLKTLFSDVRRKDYD